MSNRRRFPALGRASDLSRLFGHPEQRDGPHPPIGNHEVIDGPHPLNCFAIVYVRERPIDAFGIAYGAGRPTALAQAPQDASLARHA